MKKKKITIKPFLNESLKPIKLNDGLGHPLYILITYNRKNTHIKSYYGDYYASFDEIEKTAPGLMTFEEALVHKTVAYEVERLGDDFQLKGIGTTYESYAPAVYILVNRYLKNALIKCLRRSKHKKYELALNVYDDKVDFELLYEMAQKLYDDMDALVSDELKQQIKFYFEYIRLYPGPHLRYNFSTVIDWLEGSAKREYEHKLQKLYQEQPEKIQERIAFINQVIQKHLKQ